MDRGDWRVTVHGVAELDMTKHEQALIQFMRAKQSLHDLMTSLKPPLLNSNGSFITVSVEIKLTTFTESWRKQRCSKKKSTSGLYSNYTKKSGTNNLI